jgi:polyisoprenoid-binding protein YceI
MLRQTMSALALVSVAFTASAQPTTRVSLAPESRVWVEGTSNVHAWKATSSSLTAVIEVAVPAVPGTKVESVTLSLPVTSLKSGKGGLDKNLYKALKAEQNPTISYKMTSYTSAPEGETYAAVIGGLLTVNGVEKDVEAKAIMSGDGKGTLKAVGSTTFNMTDFGVKPVTALLGTIRTGNAVTVKFELTGAAAQAVAALPQE